MEDVIQDSVEEVVVTPEGDDAEPDYKALYQEAKAQAEKSENDRKAALGSRRSQQERDDLLWGVKDDLEAMKKSNAVLLKALSNGETDGVAAELTKIEGEGAQSRAERQFDTKYTSIYESLEEAVLDEDGQVLVDLKSEAFKPFVAEWVDAYKRKDLVDLATKLAEIQSKARKAEREKARKVVSESKAGEKAVAKKAKREAGDLDLGAASGAATGSENLTATELIARGLKKRGL